MVFFKNIIMMLDLHCQAPTGRGFVCQSELSKEIIMQDNPQIVQIFAWEFHIIFDTGRIRNDLG